MNQSQKKFARFDDSALLCRQNPFFGSGNYIGTNAKTDLQIVNMICNQPVGGSIPSVGSKTLFLSPELQSDKLNNILGVKGFDGLEIGGEFPPYASQTWVRFPARPDKNFLFVCGVIISVPPFQNSGRTGRLIHCASPSRERIK
jgi:hypothetical protein